MEAQPKQQITVIQSPPTSTPDTIRPWLSEALSLHRINTDTWGTGPYKGFDDLLAEIVSKESHLAVIGQSLFRICSVLRIDVRHKCDHESELQLYEAEQVFSDGRRRERVTPYAVWEKLKRDEDLDKAIGRALREELSIAGEIDSVYRSRELFVEPPLDFPGLPSRIDAIDYRVDLTAEQFCPEGYQERQVDKTTYFRWRAIKQSP